MTAPQNYWHQCLFSHSEPLPPTTSAGAPPMPAGMSCACSHEVTAFPLGPGVTRPCVQPSRMEFLFPTVQCNS